MNLVIITALVAVAGAAKLDRTYLPPASAKTAGGSPGSLQTPFAGNSFNNGLGGLPKGSYNNEFQGVVVDAAAAGTRASESGETGLGAPRISYGSADSKVGAAAFKVNPAGFPQPANFQNRFAGSAPDGQASGTEISQGIQRQGTFQQGSQAQGTFQQGSQAQGTFQQGSQAQGTFQQGSQGERARAALDRAANTIRFESEVGPESFNYAFETDNGITAEESGIATNGVQAKGGFSYTGDDGQVYSVTYTADERGYLPQGDHLPTPPPIPEEILKSLEQNAREEAAGLVDDGSYDAQKYNAGSDYAETDDQNGKYNHQSSKFGNRNESDATASSTFISQSNQPFARPGQFGSNSLSGSKYTSNRFESGSGTLDTTGQGSNDVAVQSEASGQFSSGLNGGQSGVSRGQPGSNFLSSSSDASNIGPGSNKFGQSGTFGTTGPSSNALLGQTATSGQFGSSSIGSTGQFETASQGQFGSSSTGFGHSSSDRLVGSSSQGSGVDGFGLTTSNRFSEQSGQNSLDSSHSQPTNSFGSSSNGADNLLQGGQSGQGNIFGNKNGYLPPKQDVNLKRFQRPKQQEFVGSNNDNAQQFHQESIIDNQNENVQPLSQQKLQGESRPQGSISGNLPFKRPSSNGFSGQYSASSTTGISAQNKPSNNAFRPSSNGDNSFPQAGSISSPAFGNRFGSKNEYLPPINSFNQNSRPSQEHLKGSNSPSTVPTSQFNQQPNTQTFDSFQGPGSSASSASVSELQPAFGSQTTQKFINFQKPQSSTNRKPNNQDVTQFPSTQGAGQSQSTFRFASLPSQRATSQPDTELTTPFETSGPQHNAADTSSSPTISSFTSSIPQSSNRLPSQPQFGTKFNNDLNSSPVPTLPSVFPAFNTQSTSGPKIPSSQIFGNRQSSILPTQASRFGTKIQESPQTSFSQNADAQFSPSTPTPDYSQQPQGSDDSYYYNQPSRPFGTPQGSIFPNAPSNNFNRVTERPSSPTAFSTQNGQFQGSTKYPKPPTISPIAPTSSSQQSNAFNGITQASISPFPSESPTQSSQFNQQGQFGSRPINQPFNQFNQGKTQPGKPSVGQQSSSSQPSFGQQTTGTPTFPQRFGNSNNQGQSPTFGQQPLQQNQPETSDETSESTTSQQYDGTIYEYNKPPQSLPAPDHQETSSNGQFGQKEQTQFGSKPSRAQFGQTDSDDSQGSTTFQFGQTVQSTKPQLGSPSRPQFGQNTQVQNKFGDQGSNFKEQSPLATRPQFGAEPTRPSDSAQSNSQFGQGADSQEPQPTHGSRPQFGSQNTGRPFSSCCQFGAQKQNKDFGVQTQNRFSAQSFSSTQGFQADPTTSSFAGKGEVFGGPRKPPSFDPETGYHY